MLFLLSLSCFAKPDRDEVPSVHPESFAQSTEGTPVKGIPLLMEEKEEEEKSHWYGNPQFGWGDSKAEKLKKKREKREKEAAEKIKRFDRYEKLKRAYGDASTSELRKSSSPKEKHWHWKWGDSAEEERLKEYEKLEQEFSQVGQRTPN